MKQIYKAVCHFLFQLDKDLQLAKPFRPEALPAGFMESLFFFERKNRGHQNELDKFELRPSGPGRPESQTVTRRDTLGTTSEVLLSAIANLSGVHLSDTPGLAQLLAVEDTSGWFRVHTEKIVHNRLIGLVRNDTRLGIGRNGCTWSKTTLSVSCELHLRGGLSKAMRVWNFEAPEKPSLGDCRQLLIDSRRQIAGDLEKTSDWPEFCKGALVTDLLKDAKDKLKRALQGYSPEDRLTLDANWAALKPTPSNRVFCKTS